MVCFNLFSSNAVASSSTAVPQPPIPSSTPIPVDPSEKCPVDHETRSKWLAANPSTAPHPLAPDSETPSSTSRPRLRPVELSHDRVISSIPRSSTSYPSPEGSVPHPASSLPHSSATGGGYQEESGKWVYPSEHQFFQALARKNHNPKAGDMRTVVPIHNAVNEKTWEEVLAWEAGMGGENCGGVRLISFSGRPKDLTPKAWVKTLVGYTPPFDRHDWLIDRCGTTVRYVIDYYAGKPDPSKPGSMAFYLDVRPAVDSWEGIRTRVAGMWR